MGAQGTGELRAFPPGPARLPSLTGREGWSGRERRTEERRESLETGREAVRNADWGEFLTMLDGRQQYIVKATAEGESYSGQAAHLRVTPSATTQRRQTIAKRALEFWGDSVLADVQMLPLWRREMLQR